MTMRLMKTIALGGLLLAFTGCGKEKLERSWSFMPNMHHQESVRPFEPSPRPSADSEEGIIPIEERKGRAMRKPIAGTVPQGFNHYTKGKLSPEAKDDLNPLPMTMDVLKAGRRAYNISCIVCHGERGEGDGNIIPNPKDPGKSYSGRQFLSKQQMAPPPSFSKGRLQYMSDGEVFNYITHGGGVMPKYDHLTPEVRWSIVNYMRVLYKASSANEEEVKAYEAVAGEYVDPEPSHVIHQWR